ncbi:hypothetical protein RD792_015832 [Penstemon davidsonii]|uniref:DNA topoisomerase (ATP-hydrolyzing) n=1 Tax=Penstemon davidsonii TaxID=160366 RepID=A0ABR0CIN5_9LAMI|nr:hypothetical protein RD792_015832 [Penstemon davidsonii]
MNLYCLQSGPHFAAANRVPLPDAPPTMAFASGLRLVRSHHPLLAFTATAPTRFLLSKRVSELRFISSVGPHHSKRLFSVKASSRRREEEVEENGSVIAVRDGGGNDGGGEGRIVISELHREATEAYMAYAMSVLLGRALPDVRDGLKPVHRRILSTDLNRSFYGAKIERIVKLLQFSFAVLGKYHPHGDTAVYDSLVRMAQDFSLRSPLIRGHGNFGSIDADPPAAMRYTECRLEDAMIYIRSQYCGFASADSFLKFNHVPCTTDVSTCKCFVLDEHSIFICIKFLQALTEAMLLADLEQDTVDFVPNFDNSQKEPSLLPARIPNLLLNGASGIAVGMATNIPPHNLGELVDALSVLIHNPEATLQELLEYMPGPDFPTGGTIMGNIGILEAYRTGRGRVVIRGKTDVELIDSRTKRLAIIIKEIPYQTNKASLVEKIAELVENKETEALTEACRLRNARSEMIDGVIDRLKDLTLVVETGLAMEGDDPDSDFNLTDKQAEAILDISLRKLTSLEKNKFVVEGKSLSEQISKLQELLSSKELILELIEAEANEIKNKFFTPRRSMLEDTDSGQLEDIDVIPNEEMLLALSEKGYLKRMKPDTFNLQNRGTIGKSVGKLRVNDTMSDFLVCRTHDHVLYFSDKGTVYSSRAYKIPECTRAAAGTPLVQILSLSDGERVTSIIPVSEFDGDQYLMMLTMKGYIKKISLNYFSSIRSTGIIAISLVPGDELKWVRCCTNDDFVAMASENGMVILSPCENIRALGRNTRGGVAMRLKQGDKMASMDIIPASLGIKLGKTSETQQTRGRGYSGPWLLFISESGFGKRVPLGNFRMSPLNRVGLKGYKFSAEDRLAAVFVVGFSVGEDGDSDEQVVLVSQSGTVNRIKVRDISVQSRYARGVILMRLEHAGKIQSASLISATESEPEEDEEAAA